MPWDKPSEKEVTDTNAAIVGGMLGALLGIHQLPKHMYTKTVNFDCD